MAVKKKNKQSKIDVTSILFYISVVTIIALAFLGKLNPLVEVLSDERFTFSVGDISITPYLILKALFAVVVVFWGAGKLSNFSAQNISKIKKFKASNRALLVKTSTIIIYSAAFIITLNIIGIDLTALTVFSGALGIGLGFGLQQITSNFISGIIMLFESSVEEGDVVELENGVYGYIRSVNARYTLVETYDGKEIMIPNEEFIVNRVVNWTYSNSRGRLSIIIGVSYDSDIHNVRKLIIDVIKKHSGVSKDMPAECLLTEFADSSVNFLVRFWVDDFSEGRRRVQSEVMFGIWDEFKKNNIEIPYPQRDINIKNINGLKDIPPASKTAVKKSTAKVTHVKKEKNSIH